LLTSVAVAAAAAFGRRVGRHPVALTLGEQGPDDARGLGNARDRGELDPPPASSPLSHGAWTPRLRSWRSPSLSPPLSLCRRILSASGVRPATTQSARLGFTAM
jgi:hypothetical protein